MAEQSRHTDPWVIFLATAVLVTGGGLFFGKPFESSRHKETIVDSLSVGTVPARLWQDPFTAVARCRQNRTTGDDKDHCASGYPQPLLEPQENNGPQELVIMPVMVYGDAYSESVEKRRRRRYAVLSAMFMQDYRPDDAQTIGYFEYVVPLDASCVIVKGKKCEAATPQETYIVPFEWLRPNTAHYQKNDNRPPVLLLWLDEHRFRDGPLEELAKLLKKVEKEFTSSTAVKVTLLGPAGSTVLRGMVREAIDWMDKANNGKSVQVFPKKWKVSIFSPVATASNKLIIGKAKSNIMEKLGYKKEIKEEEKCSFIPDCVSIYGDENTKRDTNNDKINRFTSLFLIGKIFQIIDIQFFRTITPDRNLFKEMTEKEFENRGIKVDDKNDAIILVSEWDTFYGRSLPEAFAGLIEDKRCRRDKEGECLSGVRRYAYMRGLDGEILDSELSENGASHTRSEPELERAVGASRFDYLRRLAQQIKNDFPDKLGSGNVRAVGVLGSDVYDKLLVLQALRPSFPDALFFTTDADVRYLHPAEFEWTRGLIVLAGYGLRFNHQELPWILPSGHKPELELPLFRDSYQTSMFLATQLAMWHSLSELECKKSEWWCRKVAQGVPFRRFLVKNIVTSKAFEVGRSMLVPLGEKEQEKFREQFKSSLSPILASIKASQSMLVSLFDKKEQGGSRRQSEPGIPSILSVIVVVSGFLLYAFLSALYPRRRALCIMLVVLPATLIALFITVAVCLKDGVYGEPLPLLAGTNMLPTLAVLSLAPILASIFFFKTHIDLRQDGRRLVGNFKLIDSKKWNEYLLPRGYFTHHEKLFQRWRRRLITTWPCMFLAVIHMIFSVVLINAFGDFSPPIRGEWTRYIYYCVALATLSGFFILTYLFVDEVRRCRVLAHLLATARLSWDTQTLATFAQQRNITLYNTGCVRDGLSGWVGIQLLAERTLSLEKVVYYPFIVLLLLIVAHNGLFDNWQLFVPSVAIVLVTGALVIAACFLFLRLAMEKARESALASMRAALGQGLHEGEEAHIQLRLMIEEIENERRGEFRPIGSDPIFKALLMPLGGYGGLYLIDYLTRFLQQ